MRATVLVSEYLTYIPAVVTYLRRCSRQQGVHPWAVSIALVAILMQPATILIDHGHFQYNTVMLGLVTACLEGLFAGRMLWASVFFVAALGFKQMALYFAPTIFFYLLGVCFSPRVRIGRLAGISVVTIISFLILFAPLLAGAVYDRYRGIDSETKPAQPPLLMALPITFDESSWLYPPILQLSQSIHRIFPFARGIFEDKVANLWCVFNVIYKLHRFPSELLQRASLILTLISILPSCAVICRYPRHNLLPLALSSTAWAFFLCSFQVHEKSVLLPLLPMTLLLGNEGGLSKEIRAWVGWSNIVGVWTLFPLLRRDELRVPYFVLTLLWTYILGLPPTSLNLYRNHPNAGATKNLHCFTKFLHLTYYVCMIAWHIIEAFVSPPSNKPDLWVVLNVLIGASAFGISYLWCTFKLIQQSCQKDGLKSKSSVVAESKKEQ